MVPNSAIDKPDAADDRVLPGGLERGGLPVEGDQEDRRQRGGFDRHPHHAQVVGQRDQQHREDEQRRQSVVLPELGDGRAVILPGQGAAALVVAQVADRVDRAQQGHRGRQQNHQRAEMVGVEEAVPQGHGPARQHLAAQHEGQHEGGREAGQVDRLHGATACGPAQESSAGGQGNQKQGGEDHRFR